MRVVAPLALIVLAATGCGGGHGALERSEGVSPQARLSGLGLDRESSGMAPRSKPARCLMATRPLGSPVVAYAAVVPHSAVVRAEPSSESSVVARLGRLDENGFAEVLGVVASRLGGNCAPTWYRVRLAVLPNGTEGWVRSWAVRVYRVQTRIVVDLAQRRLRLYQSGKLVMQTMVAVGAVATPTPTGRYFVNERWTLRNATGPFGPAALGISAHSAVLQNVWVEHGPIGIHGTDEPWSIGHAASNGCIRLSNSAMRALFPLVPAGTPVVVRT
jgi:lipoprotein-anchoring transpeptidase ErfK/SrfK